MTACTPSGAPPKELEERIQKQEQEIRDLKAKITEAEKINNESFFGHGGTSGEARIQVEQGKS
jgi:regulator of protease activity HflC (stomatin/prohibitin superfamily)